MAVDFQPVPSLLKDPDIIDKPLQKSSDTYTNLTRRGNLEKPSQASQANQAADTQAVQEGKSFLEEHGQQAYNYAAKVGGSIERKLIAENMVYPSDLLLMHGFLKGFGDLDFGVQPETIKALDLKGPPSTEMAYKAGNVAGILAQTYGSFAAASALGVGDVMEGALLESPKMARYLAPAATWGAAGGLSGIFQEGVNQIKAGKLDFERFGKVVLSNGAVGAAGGAIMEGLPADTFSQGLVRTTGAAAYGYGTALMEGKSKFEATINGVFMGLMGALSTKEITQAQKEGVYAGGLKRAEEATKARAVEKGYSPVEAEQLGELGKAGYAQFIESKGGIEKINVADYEKNSKELFEKIKDVVGPKPTENVLEPKQIESPSNSIRLYRGEGKDGAPGSFYTDNRSAAEWYQKKKGGSLSYVDVTPAEYKELTRESTDIGPKIIELGPSMLGRVKTETTGGQEVPAPLQSEAPVPISPSLPETDFVKAAKEKGVPEDMIMKEVYTDDLTGAWNRKYVNQKGLESEPNILFDVDNFKSVNDTHGHRMGDRVLQAITQLSQKHGFDIARLGGEEFQVYPKAGENPFIFVKRFREFQKELAQVEFKDNDGNLAFTGANISAGFGHNMESADNAAYVAKKSGKDQIHIDKKDFEAYNQKQGTNHEWTGTEATHSIPRGIEAAIPRQGEGPLSGIPERQAPLGSGNRPASETSQLTPPSLHSEIIPGAKAFAEQDVIPAAKALFKGAAETFKKLGQLFAPRAHASSQSVDALMGMKGEREKAQFQLQHSMESVKQNFDRQKPTDNVAFIDRYKTGQPQPTQELQDISDAYHKLDDSIYNQLKEFKPNLNYLDNHYRVLWKVIPGSPEARARLKAQGINEDEVSKRVYKYQSKRPIQGSKGFLKQHVLEDMSEGLALGGEPISYNPQTMFELHYADAMKFITAQKMWQTGKDIGQIKYVPSGGQKPEGFSIVNDNIARVYFPTEAGIVKTGEWYVQEDFARLLNNYLSRDIVRENALGRGMMFVKNSTTAIELAISPFHAAFETNEIMSSQIGLGIRKMLESGSRVEGLKEFSTFLASPYKVAQLGKYAIEYAGNKAEFAKKMPDAYKWFTENYPEADKLIDDLFSGGGKLAMHEDYKVNTVRTMREAWNEDNYIGATIRALPEINQAMMRPLFDKYIPRLKVGQFLKEYSFELAQKAKDIESGKITRPELSRQIWDSVENRFGEMNFDNLFWNRTFKSSLQVLFRSITWKLGNIREYDNALRGQALEFKHAASEGRVPRMTRSFGWLAGMSITAALQAILITKTTTGKYPWELAKDFGGIVKNIVYPRTSLTDEKERVSGVSYWRDAFSLVHAPGQYIKHSMSGEIGRILDVWENKDFFGTQVFDPNDPITKKGWDMMTHLIPLPFSISSFTSMIQAGESPSKAVMSFMAINKAPGWVSQSKAEEMVSGFIQQSMPAVRSKEQFEKTRDAREILDSLRGQEEKTGKIAQAIREGKIRPDQAKIVYMKSRYTALQNAVKYGRITMDQALNVVDVATPEERATLKYIIYSKFKNSVRTMPTKKIGETLKQIQSIYPQ